MSKDTVKKNCPFYHHPKSYKMLQTKRNCYLCPLVELEMKKKDLQRTRTECLELSMENKDLKLLLGEKVVKEYQASKRRKRSDNNGSL